jgi:sugar/nucleoside kinase (ribokinase family)
MFHPAYIYGLLQAWELDRQLDLACAAAALNCTAAGARGGIRTVEEIEALVRQGERYEAVYPAPHNTVFA